jgi:hypothetical protein
VGRCINIPFWDRGKFSDRDGTLSGTLCLAWAEERLNKLPICLIWQEDRIEAAWVPTTDDPGQAKMSEDGDGVCHWKHVVWLRARRARFESWLRHKEYGGGEIGERDVVRAWRC